jgi:acetyl esterase/lipase
VAVSAQFASLKSLVMTAVLVTLHGGNFVGGDATWDRAQTALLQALGYLVYQVEFPTETLSAALAYLRHKVADLKKGCGSAPFYVLGRSSGGYLAKVLFDEGLFDRALYLAPVFDPLMRAALVPKLGTASQTYFSGQPVPHTRAWTAAKELLLCPVSDKRVPWECFTPEQREHSIQWTMTHEEICQLVTDDFRGLVRDFLK